MQRRLNCLGLGVVLLVGVLGASGGCGGGCSGLVPLDAPVPADQTVEGGAQLRITPGGFAKFQQVIAGMLSSSLGTGMCIGQTGFSAVADVDVCDQDECAGGARGCGVTTQLNGLTITPIGGDKLRIDTTISMAANGHATAYDPLFGFRLGGCDLQGTLNNGHMVADIKLSTRESDGQLDIHFDGLQTLDISGLDVGGCFIADVAGAILGFFADILSTQLGNLLVGLFSDTIDNLVQGFLPDPIGIVGGLDLKSMLGSMGGHGIIETRAVPGGYVTVDDGLTLGVIIGLNTDRDTSTRTPDLDNEPDRCVPQRSAPNLAGLGLPLVPVRNTYKLDPAGAFAGNPEPSGDLAIGMSETSLDMLGHDLVSAGGLCLRVGSETLPQLNLGTFGLLAPSLFTLGTGSGKEPMLLVLRPQQPVDFSIGSGASDADPNLTLHLTHLQIDFYAFLFDRYTRVFTLDAILNIGIQLDVGVDDAGNPALIPMLTGLDASAIMLDVQNADILAEPDTQLEAIFPTVFAALLPQLAGALGPMTLPQIGGFNLDQMEIGKVTTTEDDFLSISARLTAASAARRELMDKGAALLGQPVLTQRAVESVGELHTTATLVSVEVPAPGAIRTSILDKTFKHMPVVTVDLSTSAPPRTQVEYQWREAGGMWRPWTRDSRLVLKDQGFAMQGRHTLEFRARAVGDIHSVDTHPVQLPVVIDSAAPALRQADTKAEGDGVRFVADDLISANDAIGYAIITPGHEPAEAGDWRAWKKDGHFTKAELDAVADKSGQVVVLLVDEKGNIGEELVDLTVIGFHGREPAGDGCGCSVGARQGQGGLGAMLFVGVILAGFGVRRLRRRTVKRAALVVGVIFVGALPGCDCSGDKAGQSCTMNEDCLEFCDAPQIGYCDQSGQCVCVDDVPPGDIGAFSDLAVSPDGSAWISAYNRAYGDLMVAQVSAPGRVPVQTWQFLDGVPDGPVVVPTSSVRGGIFESGQDVGKYTSIAVNAESQPMIAYHDSTAGSLKLAYRGGENIWTSFVVDEGMAIQPEIGGEQAGRSTSITIDPITGRVGIAYLALVVSNGQMNSELRFAESTGSNPVAGNDFSVVVVDTGTATAPTSDDPDELPPAVGLFISAARKANGDPVLAYYDRINGDLKLATRSGGTWTTQVVDGQDGTDQGYYPSLQIDQGDGIHIVYVNEFHDALTYLSMDNGFPEVIDDGYREDGTTPDGLPVPVFHMVGDDAALMLASGGSVAVAYQDATSHELLFATRNFDGTWDRQTLAGAEDPFVGGYGFFAAARASGGTAVISTWVINQKTPDSWVEVFKQTISID